MNLFILTLSLIKVTDTGIKKILYIAFSFTQQLTTKVKKYLRLFTFLPCHWEISFGVFYRKSTLRQTKHLQQRIHGRQCLEEGLNYGSIFGDLSFSWSSVKRPPACHAKQAGSRTPPHSCLLTPDIKCSF